MTDSVQVVRGPAGNAMTVEQVQQTAKAVVASGLFPNVKNIESAVTLMLLCQAEGLHPIMALRRYDIIQGRPAFKSDAMLAEFQKRGGKVRWVELSDEAAEAEFMSAGLMEPVRIRFDTKDADRAGLLTKENWRKYPRAMRRARVISEGIRTADPGVNAGVYTPEEVRDFSDEKPETPKPADYEVLGDPGNDAEEKPLGQVLDTAAVRRAEQVERHAPKEYNGKMHEERLSAEKRREARTKLMSDWGDAEIAKGRPVAEVLKEIEAKVRESYKQEQDAPHETAPPLVCTKRGCDSGVGTYYSTSKQFPDRAYYQCKAAYDERERLLLGGATNKAANAAVTGHYRDWAEPWPRQEGAGEAGTSAVDSTETTSDAPQPAPMAGD